MYTDYFALAIDELSDGRHVSVAGDVDLVVAESLYEELVACDTTEKVTVDMRNVTFCDVAGVRAIVSARQRLEVSGCRMELTDVRPRVRQLFELLGVGDALA